MPRAAMSAVSPSQADQQPIERVSVARLQRTLAWITAMVYWTTIVPCMVVSNGAV
jgi:hypothetical protein